MLYSKHVHTLCEGDGEKEAERLGEGWVRRKVEKEEERGLEVRKRRREGGEREG